MSKQSPYEIFEEMYEVIPIPVKSTPTLIFLIFEQLYKLNELLEAKASNE